MVAALAVVALGALAPTVHAASPHAALDCSATPIAPPAVYHTLPGDSTPLPGIGGWVGSTPMEVELTNSCATYSNIEIDTSGQFTNLPSLMIPGTYQMITTQSSIAYLCVPETGIQFVVNCNLQNTTFTLTTDSTGTPTDSVNGEILCNGNTIVIAGQSMAVPGLSVIVDSPLNGTGTATPELSSADLLGVGLVPLFGLFMYRRRRRTPTPGAVEVETR